MKREQIDELLQSYAVAESRIAVNLHDLADHTTYELLKNGTLEGVTALRVGPTLDDSEDLWELFSHFHDALGRAQALRGTGKRVDNNNEAQLVRLLTEPSILISTTATPLAERGLLDSTDSERRITFDQAIARMRAKYEPIRDAVADVQRVQRDVLPRLGAIATTLAEARQTADALGVTEPELSRAERRLEQVRVMAIDDPLGLAPNEGDKLEQLARLAVGRVAALRAGRDNLDADLASVEGLIAEIRTLRARAEAAGLEAVEKIAGADGVRAVPSEAAIDGPNGVAARARGLVDGPASSWQGRRSALDDWMRSARRLRDQLFRAGEANRAQLRVREELRGLLTAYRAKMAGVGKAEDPVATELADEAHNELYTRPTDLDRARRLLRELGAAVS